MCLKLTKIVTKTFGSLRTICVCGSPALKQQTHRLFIGNHGNRRSPWLQLSTNNCHYPSAFSCMTTMPNTPRSSPLSSLRVLLHWILFLYVILSKVTNISGLIVFFIAFYIYPVFYFLHLVTSKIMTRIKIIVQLFFMHYHLHTVSCRFKKYETLKDFE